MTIRTSRKTVAFTRSFVLAGSDEVFPAGHYVVETDEELLEGLSFPAYRRVLTLIHLHPERQFPGRLRVMTIDPIQLEAALLRDQLSEEPPAPWAKYKSSVGEKHEALSKEADIRALERADNEGMIARPK